MSDYDKQLHKLFSHASRVKMTKEDKLALKNVILSRTGIIPIKTPYFIHMISMVSQSRYATTFVALFFVLSGSMGYASNYSLPGDTLYPVKTEMTEKVESFLVLGEKSKAKNEVKLAERRLEEATTLARSGKLKEEVQVELQKNIEEHVAKASVHIAVLTQKEDLLDAIEITGQLESTLKVHSESLAQISESENTTQSSTAVATLIASVAVQTQVAQEATSRVEVEVAAKAPETDPTGEISDFLDTEALDTLDEDFFDGDLTYKDELFITDGEVVSDDIDAPKEVSSKKETEVQKVEIPLAEIAPKSISPITPSITTESTLKSFISPFKY